jgi:hypothetical protein
LSFVRELERNQMDLLMFVEELVQSALARQDSWFVADHLLLDETRGVSADVAAQEIADRNELQLERFDDDALHGYRFWRRPRTA